MLAGVSVAIYEAFEYSMNAAAADIAAECDAGEFALSYLNHLPRMMVAILGGGEEYVLCFVNSAASPTAGVLMFTFLVFAVVILMNMLIAMMAKTFDEVRGGGRARSGRVAGGGGQAIRRAGGEGAARLVGASLITPARHLLLLQVFSHSERNYRVMRVKFYVGYSDSDDWPAPLNALYFPLFLANTFGCCGIKGLLACCAASFRSAAQGVSSCLDGFARCKTKIARCCCCSSEPEYDEMEELPDPDLARLSATRRSRSSSISQSLRRSRSLEALPSASTPLDLTDHDSVFREDLDRCVNGR